MSYCSQRSRFFLVYTQLTSAGLHPPSTGHLGIFHQNVNSGLNVVNVAFNDTSNKTDI